MGAVKINGTTSGSVSLEAPATGSDVTLTLPGTTMNLGTELASKLPIAGGKILQIVRATDTTGRSTTSTSYVDVTGMSVTITPQKSDSAILIIATFLGQTQSALTSNVYGLFAITDSSNNVLSGAEQATVGNGAQTANANPVMYVSMIGRSTPATISAVTYKLRFRSSNASITTEAVNNVTTGQLYAIEVSA